MKDNSAAAVRLAPVGLLSIAAFLLLKGHEVRIEDLSLSFALSRSKEFLDRLISFRPDYVGFTAVTSSFLNGYDLAAAIKLHLPEVKIVFGGVHVSALRGKILEQFSEIDFIITGEGEKALSELVEGKTLPDIQGLVYREGQEIKDNGLRTDVLEMDTLPFPAYELLEGFPKGYISPLFNYHKAPTAAIISSRGCPYQCSYCDRSVFRRSFRFNSADYLYDHMRFLRREYGIRHITFYDDLFTFNRERIEKLCNLLIDEPLGMTYNCAVRVGHADDDLLKLLKASGCWMVSLGIESGAPEILARHKTKVDFSEMQSTVKRIQKAGLRAKGLFMLGLPGETEETVKVTEQFVQNLELDDMNLTKFTPFHGSPIYQNIHEEGTFEEKWELMNCLNFVFVPKGIASRQRINQLYNGFVTGFYSHKNWIRKFPGLLLKSPHSAWRLIKNLPTFLKIRKDFSPEKQ